MRKINTIVVGFMADSNYIYVPVRALVVVKFCVKTTSGRILRGTVICHAWGCSNHRCVIGSMRHGQRRSDRWKFDLKRWFRLCHYIARSLMFNLLDHPVWQNTVLIVGTDWNGELKNQNIRMVKGPIATTCGATLCRKSLWRLLLTCTCLTPIFWWSFCKNHSLVI